MEAKEREIRRRRNTKKKNKKKKKKKKKKKYKEENHKKKNQRGRTPVLGVNVSSISMDYGWHWSLIGLPSMIIIVIAKL